MSLFHEITNTLSTLFALVIIIGVICIFVAIVKGISNNAEQTKKMQQEKNANEKLVNTIISESLQLSTSALISQRNEVFRAYDELVACKKAGSFKIKEFVWIKVGNDFGCSMDINTCYKVLQYLNTELERRGVSTLVDHVQTPTYNNSSTRSFNTIPNQYTSENTEEAKTNQTFSETYENERNDILRRQFCFVDCSGSYRRWGDSFVDYKGNHCQWGDSFYDYDGNYIHWGGTYKDSSGAYRNWGDDFVDYSGNWIKVK